MTRRTTKNGIKRIINLCDELGELRHRIRDASPRSQLQQRLRLRARRKVETLAAELRSYRFGGVLGELVQRRRLSAHHFLILAILLQAYLRGGSPYVEGRAILKRVYFSTWHALQAAVLLAPDGVLRQSGAIVPDEECAEHEDVLQTRFRLAEPLVEAFCQEIMGVPRSVRPPARRAGYQSASEHLLDLRALHNLYHARADVAFGTQWDHVIGGVDGVRAHDRRIRALSARIAARLKLTPGSDAFPAVRFQRENGLAEPEMMLVVHLVFREIHEGSAFADVVELLRLVSGSERDLIANRGMFDENAPLVRREILVLDDMFETRPLTGEARLGSGVMDQVVGGDPRRGTITPDERLDFHRFLKQLESSTPFERERKSDGGANGSDPAGAAR